MFCCSTDPFLHTSWFPTSVSLPLWDFFPSVDNALELYVPSIGIAFTSTMISLVLRNSFSTYCFSFLLNFLNLSIPYLCLAVFPKTDPNSSTVPSKFCIDDVFGVILERLPHTPYHWELHLPPRPHWPLPRPLLPVFDSLVGFLFWVIAVIISATASRGWWRRFQRNFLFKSILNPRTKPFSAWDVTHEFLF